LELVDVSYTAACVENDNVATMMTTMMITMSEDGDYEWLSDDDDDDYDYDR